MSHLLELVEGADRSQDGKIDFDEWQIMGKPESYEANRILTEGDQLSGLRRKYPWLRITSRKCVLASPCHFAAYDCVLGSRLI